MYLPLAFVFFCFVIAVTAALIRHELKIAELERKNQEDELLANIKQAKEGGNAARD